MLKLMLARHGETAWNRDKKIQGGASDTELAEKGIEQARRLGLALKDVKLTAIYSSPLKRALETARAAARYHGIEVQVAPELCEIMVGSLDGQRATDMRQSLSQYIMEQANGDFLKLPGGGESLTDLDGRVSVALDRILAAHHDGTVLIVAHHFVLASVLCRLMSMPVGHIGRFRMDLGSISVVTMSDGKTCLLSFSDTCHLSQ